MRRPSKSVIILVFLALAQAAQNPEQNAVYATQLTFEASSPIIYITTGICIGKAGLAAAPRGKLGKLTFSLVQLTHHCIFAESAVKVGDKIQIFLPGFQDLLSWQFTGLAKNLAYIVTFEEDKAAYDFSKTSFTIDTRAGKIPVELVQNIIAKQSVMVASGLLSNKVH